MLHNLNSGIKSERELKQKDSESCRILMQQKIETLEKSIDEIEAQAHLIGFGTADSPKVPTTLMFSCPRGQIR